MTFRSSIEFYVVRFTSVFEVKYISHSDFNALLFLSNTNLDGICTRKRRWRQEHGTGFHQPRRRENRFREYVVVNRNKLIVFVPLHG